MPTDKNSSIVLQTKSLTKSYQTNNGPLPILDTISVSIEKASFLAIMGPSGSGKSTLMQCAAGLDRPDSGEVWLGETNLMTLTEKELDKIRRERIGFVFQAFNLLPMLNVFENVALPVRLAKKKLQRSEVMDVLKSVGLEQKATRLPAELSGGEQQRVAIARTLIAQPEVIFADEPTGSLDTVTSSQVLKLLRTAIDEYGKSVVMVTHDLVAASWADQVIFLVDGKIRNTLSKPTVTQIAKEISQWSQNVQH